MTKSQRIKLRELLRETVLTRDKGCCRRCGNTMQLAPSHIYPKGKYPRMEFDLDNVLTLCYRCHIIWWHKNPIEACEWINSILSLKIKERLKLRTQIIEYGSQDAAAIALYLKEEKKKYA